MGWVGWPSGRGESMTFVPARLYAGSVCRWAVVLALAGALGGAAFARQKQQEQQPPDQPPATQAQPQQPDRQPPPPVAPPDSNRPPVTSEDRIPQSRSQNPDISGPQDERPYPSD